MKNAREAALIALYEIEYNNAYSNIALKNILKAEKLDARDRAFVTTLVYGVISKKITLDYMIEKLSKIKLKKLSKYILLILRIGLFQIKFLDKVPDSAAVNECVRLAKRYGHSASSGYVNGVLRNAAKADFNEISEPHIRYSFAKEVYLKLKEDYPDNIELLLEALSKEAKTTIRANRLKISRDELMRTIGGTICPITNDGIYVQHTDISGSKEYYDGLYTVQDASPMAVCNALNPQEGDFVIDTCAAPGGKTTYIAELMNNKGRIVAFDIYPHRVDLIKKNAERLGIDIIEASVHDAQIPCEQYLFTADKVICDVPCSGIGIARRKPELKYKSDFDGLSDVQYNILKASAGYLKKGGVMIYSTCTLYKDENERIVEKFLRENSEFKLISMQETLPEGFFETSEGIMTVLPNITDCDGFFAAKFERCK